MGVTHLFRNAESHTTARYFESVARADPSTELRVWTGRPDLEEIGSDDLFVFVDPAPDWPLGLESLPCPSIAYLIDVHQYLPMRLDMSRFFDAVFIAQKDYVPAFVELGHRHAYWLPLGCDPVLHHAPSDTRDLDVGFVGNLGAPGTPRNTVLTSVLPRYTTNDYKRFYPPEDMARIYGRSKIVFNVSVNGDVNMRAFEALASGALLVTDRIHNGFDEIFQDGVNCVCYSDIDEAIARIDHYLAHDSEREAIAAEGMRFVLAECTYRHRWETMTGFARQAMGSAPARGYTKAELGDAYARIYAAIRKPWRVLPMLARYGVSRTSLVEGGTALARWANTKVPLTPNALRARLRNRSTRR
jgi:hypothetical protein